jgi:hypothetical protein
MKYAFHVMCSFYTKNCFDETDKVNLIAML